jgi:hypothetical protein
MTQADERQAQDAKGEAKQFPSRRRDFAQVDVSVRSDTRMEAELKPQRRPRAFARSWRARRSSAVA